MGFQSITLNLPDVVMRRAKQAADTLQHPVEEVLASVLTVTLPDVEDAPPSMRAELARMTWLSERDLWTIAHSVMTDQQQEEMQRLAELQAERPLTAQEERRLDTLRQEYGRTTLRKARAYALLSLRSGRPLLAEN
jgi:hypothetical protein